MNDGIAKMGEVVFSDPELTALRALGLGSCIGLCVLDPMRKQGCLAHIMLPDSRSTQGSQPGKYADTAVDYVVSEMTARGAAKSGLRVAIAGGAQLFSFQGDESVLDVGKRNAESVIRAMDGLHLKLIAKDVGGSAGRTVFFDVATGKVMVRQLGQGETLLADLAS